VPNEFLGHWKIVQMDTWAQDYVDLVVPGHVTFEDDGLGEFQFGTVVGWLDCRFNRDDRDRPLVEFSWDGRSDSDPGCGRGWARIEDGKLMGHLFIHCSDDSAFVAERR
jgi:hypothetical protein